MHSTKHQSLVVFEHDSWRSSGDVRDERLLEGLQTFYGEKGVPYYSLTHHGVKFSSYVGVLQVGDTLIEVLPKIDKHETDEGRWRDILINMVRAVNGFKTDAPTSASLKLRPNSLLDLYFEIFLNEVKQLLHKGLIKNYRKVEENQYALRGALKFNKHLSENMIHRERFFVRHSVYDQQHPLNQILYKALNLIYRLNRCGRLNTLIGNLRLNFPEMDDILVSSTLFERITYNRKNLAYKKAIEIARLILLNYHPGLRGGNDHVLALMFDMNTLFERYVSIEIKRAATKKDYRVNLQRTEVFWAGDSGKKTLKPDIIISKDSGTGIDTWIVDTKWKVPANNKPADEDLKQMFAYSHLFEGQKTYLIYPKHVGSESVSGAFQKSCLKEDSSGSAGARMCYLQPVEVVNGDGLVKDIGDSFVKDVLG